MSYKYKAILESMQTLTGSAALLQAIYDNCSKNMGFLLLKGCK